jgi:hypothetical protein
MFFTSGLLHWVERSLSLVPAEVPVALVGSRLTPEERTWIPEHFRRPFHHIDVPADDKVVWEYLFRTNRFNFGWLDIDCFVLNDRLFGEMCELSEDALANVFWSFRCKAGFDLLNTYFIVLNADVKERICREVEISPGSYSFERTSDSRLVPGAYCHIPSQGLVHRLRQALPAGENGRPIYLSESSFYDTLHVFQIVAQTMGYRLHQVRGLCGLNTEEIVHVGKVSYYRTGWKARDEPRNRPYYHLLLLADFLALSAMERSAPILYDLLRVNLSRQIRDLGLPAEPDKAFEAVCQALASQGIGKDAVRRILTKG